MDFDPDTPDDDGIIASILSAAKDILGETIAASGPVGEASSVKAVMDKIDQAIARRGLNPAKTKGEIGLKAEVFLDFDEDAPDDIQLANRILAAAREVLGEVL